MKKTIVLAAAFLFSSVTLFISQLHAGEGKDLLMGAVVKSDRWKVNRKNNTENFSGNVSFKNPDYDLKADKAVYFHNEKRWTLKDSVYAKRKLKNNSSIEIWCDKGIYLEKKEYAELSKEEKPVKMKFTSSDGVIDGKADNLSADNRKGQMLFTGSFFLTTENIKLFSAQGTYLRDTDNFFLHDTEPSTEGMPLAVGKREGNNFALRAETMDFYKETRDLKCKKRVTGWVKDIPYLEDLTPAGSLK